MDVRSMDMVRNHYKREEGTIKQSNTGVDESWSSTDGDHSLLMDTKCLQPSRIK